MDDQSGAHAHNNPTPHRAENPQQAERLLAQLAEGQDGEGGDPRACYALAVLLASRLQSPPPQQQQQQQKRGGRERGLPQGGKGKEEEDGERVYRLLCRAVQGGVLPAVHNLANLLAQGQGCVRPRFSGSVFCS